MTTMKLSPLVSVLAVALAACGGAATTAPSATPTSSPTATTAPATPAPATPSLTAATSPSGKAWTVASTSKATVSVREQLVSLSLPSDAVLVATGAAGAFQLNTDGTFTADSKISFDLNTLASDQRDRDNFIKQDTLQV